MESFDPPPPVDALLDAGRRLVRTLEYPERAFIDAIKRVDTGESASAPSMFDLGRAKLVSRCFVARTLPGFCDVVGPLYNLMTALSRYLMTSGGDWMGVYMLLPDTFEAMATRASTLWMDGTALPRAFWACLDSVEKTLRRSVAMIQAKQQESPEIAAAFRVVRIALEQSRALTKRLLHVILSRSSQYSL